MKWRFEIIDEEMIKQKKKDLKIDSILNNDNSIPYTGSWDVEDGGDEEKNLDITSKSIDRKGKGAVDTIESSKKIHDSIRGLGDRMILDNTSMIPFTLWGVEDFSLKKHLVSNTVLEIEENKEDEAIPGLQLALQESYEATPIQLAVDGTDSLSIGKIKKKQLPAVVKRCARLMEAEGTSTLEKAGKRASFKSLESGDPGHVTGESSFLGTTMVNVLFNTCSNEQLIQLGSNCGLNLNPVNDFNPIDKIMEMENDRIRECSYKQK